LELDESARKQREEEERLEKKREKARAIHKA